MRTFLVGDVQGCVSSLERLLDKINFCSSTDRLWLAGDIVNRGPKSLDTLRLVKQLGSCANSVLGNHDLHLLAVNAGCRRLNQKDTLTDILTAPDVEELIDWLRQRPLMIYDSATHTVLCHAGIHPAWDLQTAMREAHNVENQLRADNYQELFSFMYGDKPRKWKPSRSGEKRLRFAINSFTRMRYCTSKGKLNFTEKGKPGTQVEGLLPWFQVEDRKAQDVRIVFGHWSTVGTIPNPLVIGLDTGCIWGGKLTAYELETGQFHSVFCPISQHPW